MKITTKAFSKTLTNKKLFSALTLAVLPLMMGTAVGQQESTEWELPRTAEGHPVLQGYWTNSTVVPLERSLELGTQAFYTVEEAANMQNEALALAIGTDTVAGTAADMHYQMDDYALNKSADTIASNLRTSIITSPSNGRFPETTAEAKAEAAAYTTHREEHGYDSAQDRGLSERCLIWANEGPPMLPLGYNSTLQIIQSKGYIAILMEMIHDLRIIPIREQATDTEILPQWLGNSVGHWEGDTLIIETTGFSGKTVPVGIKAIISVDTQVVERISRSAEGTLNYQFTIEDPSTWESSWSGEYPMQAIDGPMFEYACHEGNYGIVNILNGVRVEERRALEAAKQL